MLNAFVDDDIDKYYCPMTIDFLLEYQKIKSRYAHQQRGTSDLSLHDLVMARPMCAGIYYHPKQLVNSTVRALDNLVKLKNIVFVIND